MAESVNIDCDAIVRELDAILEYHQSSQSLRVGGSEYEGYELLMVALITIVIDPLTSSKGRCMR